ncbi:MAG: hypothetical protein ACT6QS_14335 [Flavobacteriales bacterium]
MNKGIRRILTTILAGACITVASAQYGNVYDTYSQLGVGRVSGNVQAGQMAMGGIGAAYVTTDLVNYSNPASYAHFRNIMLTFGGEYNSYSLIRGNSRTGLAGGFFNQFAVGVPIYIKRKPTMGISFGYIPYSQAGYAFTINDAVASPEDTINVKLNYQGKGGVDRIYLGYGATVAKGLSLGINGSFYFGSLLTEKNSTSEANGFLNTSWEQNLRITDFSFDAGVMYTDTISVRDSLGRKRQTPWFVTVGGTYSYGNRMRAKTTILGKYFTSTDITGTPYLIDTLLYRERSTVRFPSTFGVGFSFGKINNFLIGTEFQYQLWSQFRNSNGQAEPYFSNSYTAALGAEYTANKPKGFFNKLTYRAGFRYGNSYVAPLGTPFSEFGISFGVGFPIIINALLKDENSRVISSMLNLGVEYSSRSHPDPSITRMNSWRVVLSFNLRERRFYNYKFK